MQDTLQALVGLLIQSVPTILLFIFLVIYLNATYFRPVARILDERREKTEGVKELARKAFESADQKANEFERALQLARAQISQEFDAMRRVWAQEQAAAQATARTEAEKKIAAGREAIAQEVERAKSDLDTQVEALSTAVVEHLVRRRAA
jgi:F-type H+-transporting ATPase subunit b